MNKEIDTFYNTASALIGVSKALFDIQPKMSNALLNMATELAQIAAQKIAEPAEKQPLAGASIDDTTCTAWSGDQKLTEEKIEIAADDCTAYCSCHGQTDGIALDNSPIDEKEVDKKIADIVGEIRKELQNESK